MLVLFPLERRARAAASLSLPTCATFFYRTDMRPLLNVRSPPHSKRKMSTCMGRYGAQPCRKGTSLAHLPLHLPTVAYMTRRRVRAGVAKSIRATAEASDMPHKAYVATEGSSRLHCFLVDGLCHFFAWPRYGKAACSGRVCEKP